MMQHNYYKADLYAEKYKSGVMHMNKKIAESNSLSRIICLVLGLSLCGGAVWYGAKKVEFVAASSVSVNNNAPIIILDAGHGEYS